MATLLTTAMYFFTGCTPPNDAGKDILPKDDFIQGVFVDTFDIQFTTIKTDNVISEKQSRSLFGNYVDEEFGSLFAEAYFQPRITGSNLSFGSDPSKFVLDSVTMSIDLTGVYGRFDSPLELEIFEVDEAFPEDGLLNTRTEVSFDSSYDYANGYTMDFSGLSGFFDFVTFRLDDSLGRKLLFAPEDTLVTNSVFTQFFRGLVLRTKPVDQSASREAGAIYQIDPRSDRTSVTLHYTDDGEPKIYIFRVTDISERYHRISRGDLTGKLLFDVLSDSANPYPEYAALQSGGLVKLAIKVPDLIDIDPAGINRAELILPVNTSFLGSNDRYAPPAGAFLFVADSTGKNPFDASLIASTSAYDAANEQYLIPITNNVQNILAGRLPDNGFVVTPIDERITVNRVVLNGPGHPERKPKVRVVYTTLPGKK